MEQQPQQITITEDDTTQLMCKCGSPIFEQVFMMRKVSALISPSGKAEFFQIPLVLCKACGEPFDEEDEEKSSIIT